MKARESKLVDKKAILKSKSKWSKLLYIVLLHDRKRTYKVLIYDLWSTNMALLCVDKIEECKGWNVQFEKGLFGNGFSYF